MKCADPTYHCCSSGNYSVCCPASATCINTVPPMCLDERLDDPNACTEEVRAATCVSLLRNRTSMGGRASQVCKPDHHCPLSKVDSCCLGGETCCPENGQCTGSDPPMCRALTGWEYLNRRHHAPVTAVPGTNVAGAKSAGDLRAAVFHREPIPLVPIATRPPTPAPTTVAATGSNATGAANSTESYGHGAAADAAAAEAARRYDALPCPQCEKTLFPKAPTGTRQQHIVMTHLAALAVAFLAHVCLRVCARIAVAVRCYSAPGERSRQKSFLVQAPAPDAIGERTYRIVITETQHTVAMPGGGLRTTTHRVRSTTLLPADRAQQHLWPAASGAAEGTATGSAKTAADDFTDALRRLQAAKSAGAEGVRALDAKAAEENTVCMWHIRSVYICLCMSFLALTHLLFTSG